MYRRYSFYRVCLLATLLDIVYYWLEKNSVVLDVRGEGVEDGELEESVEERGDKTFYELAARSKKNQYIYMNMYLICMHTFFPTN